MKTSSDNINIDIDNCIVLDENTRVVFIVYDYTENNGNLKYAGTIFNKIDKYDSLTPNEIEFHKKTALSRFNKRPVEVTIDTHIPEDKINKKVRKLALAQTLSKKNLDKSLHILADVKKEIKKTKEFNKFLEKNKIANVLIISDDNSMKNINKTARNIKNVKLIKDEGANIYDLFKYENVIITSTSAKRIQERVLNEKN